MKKLAGRSKSYAAPTSPINFDKFLVDNKVELSELKIGDKTSILDASTGKSWNVHRSKKNVFFIKEQGELFNAFAPEYSFIFDPNKKICSAEGGALIVGHTDINGREGERALMPDGKIWKVGGGEIILNEKSSTKHCEQISKWSKEDGGVAFNCDAQKVANADRAAGAMPAGEYHQEAAGGHAESTVDKLARLRRDLIALQVRGDGSTQQAKVLERQIKFLQQQVKNKNMGKDKTAAVGYKKPRITFEYAKQLMRPNFGLSQQDVDDCNDAELKMLDDAAANLRPANMKNWDLVTKEMAKRAGANEEWIDPAGGSHGGDDDDPASDYAASGTKTAKFHRGDDVRVAKIITSIRPEKLGMAGVVSNEIGRGLYAVKFADGTASTFTAGELGVMPGAEGGTQTQKTTKMNLYYLKPGNVINEPKYNLHYKITRCDKEGVHFVPASDLIAAENEQFLMYGLFLSKMEDKGINIEGCPYENDRDKILLQNEITAITEGIEKQELESELSNNVAIHAQTTAELAAAQEESEKNKTAFGDTIKGMEALAGGGNSARLSWGDDAGCLFATGKANEDGFRNKYEISKKGAKHLLQVNGKTTAKGGMAEVKAAANKEERKVKTGSAAAGAKIENQYGDNDKFPTFQSIWAAWTPDQRNHFIDDHGKEAGLTEHGIEQAKKVSKYTDLGHGLMSALVKHVSRGQYSGGKKVRQIKGNKSPAMLKKQEILMKNYAAVLGYDVAPFSWAPTDYTVAGWEKLIKDTKKSMVVSAAGGTKASFKKGAKVYVRADDTRIPAIFIKRLSKFDSQVQIRKASMGYHVGDITSVATSTLTAR